MKIEEYLPEIWYLLDRERIQISTGTYQTSTLSFAFLCEREQPVIGK